MQSVATLATFSSLASSFPDTLFFRTHENPTVVNIDDIGKRPGSWEHVAFDGNCPDTEEALCGFQKGNYLIFHSTHGGTTMFYRVRGAEASAGGGSPFKQALTIIDRLERAADQTTQRKEEAESVAAELARKLDKEKRKRKKLKKKLKEAGEHQWGDLIEIFVTTVCDRFGIALVQDDGEPPTTTGAQGTGAYYDDDSLQ